MELLAQFLSGTGFYSITPGNIIMVAIGVVFIALAVFRRLEPTLLIPIGFGILVGNIPSPIPRMGLSVYDEGSVFYFLYQGVELGIYPPLIFLGIGAMTDLSAMISNPKLVLLGIAAQVGIFLSLISALYFGFSLQQAAAIGVIGSGDGPTAIFLSSQIAPDLISAIAIAAYSYMAFVPLMQPPIMKLLTTREERLIRMPSLRQITTQEKIVLPIGCFIITALLAPGSLELLGMLFFGNLLRESAVTERLATSARGGILNVITILLGFTVGASAQAQVFIKADSLLIFLVGAFSFCLATAGGILFAKLLNRFSEKKINPLLGAAGVSAIPDSARIVHLVAQEEDSDNFLLSHAIAPNTAGIIGSAIAAGLLWSFMLG